MDELCCPNPECKEPLTQADVHSFYCTNCGKDWEIREINEGGD